MDGYIRGSHVKFKMSVHVIFVTKYRKSLLVGEIQNDVKQFLYEASRNKGISIQAMETDKNHVHMLFSYHPSMNVSALVKYLKQYSTYYIWKHHEGQLKKYYWKRKILWSDGYFVCSVGQISQTIVKKYIKQQG